jgi:hypothetical protein
MILRFEVRHVELDVLGAVVTFHPKGSGRTTDPSGVAMLPRMML